ncbi:MAG: Xaa-Pro peptidase family protein [Bacteroidota bacterium]
MKITKAEYKTRIERLQSMLQASSLDTLIVSEEEDIYYLTGLTYKSLERLFLLVVKEEEISFILPKMELAHLKSVDHVQHIKHYWEYPAQTPERWQDVLYEEVKASHSIGLSKKAPYEIGAFLASMDLNSMPCAFVEELRWVKSETEIELIRRASHYCNLAVLQLNQNAYFGMTELEVFSIGRDIQKRLIIETDFDYLASNVLIAAWPSRISDQPHGVPRVDDLLVEGSHISLAFLRVNGYAAELERTFFTSPPTKEQEEIFALMMEARAKSYAALKAGVPAESVDHASKHFLEQQGFKDNLMHRTGHGIGLGNHEGPFLADGDQTILQENMVVSIEPGIYIEGVGGFRHSDTVRITKDGYEILTSCADDLASLIFTQTRPMNRLKGKLIKRMFRI